MKLTKSQISRLNKIIEYYDLDAIDKIDQPIGTYILCKVETEIGVRTVEILTDGIAFDVTSGGVNVGRLVC